ncbi:MAG: hypothetical protein NC206_04290 [Bacteroides sp.]|nr:hypothetical protein [Roseburia sp.]MCM1346283.1 hypothetical protein [Bacteroides sp.]MCM1420862.1 hypothetical protein [Bacteroides sp.]
MKKIFLLITACAGLLLASCDDDDKLNTGDAIVSMGQPTYSVKESKGLFTVPVSVTGKQNGQIEVTVAVSVVDENCKEDEHFLITSKKITIPASKQTGNIEIKTVDDHIINDDRTFDLVITDVKGAKIDNTLASTRVTLVDNDALPYDRMGGSWTVTATNLMDENEETITWTTNLLVNDYSDETPDNSKEYAVTPWPDWTGETLDILSFPLYFNYDATTRRATVKIQLGSTIAEDINFNSDGSDPTLEKCRIIIATPSTTGYSTSGTLTGTVSEDFETITFDYPMLGIIFSSTSQPYAYFFSFSNLKFTFNK